MYGGSGGGQPGSTFGPTGKTPPGEVVVQAARDLTREDRRRLQVLSKGVT